MRIRLTTRRGVLFGAMLAVALVACLPLRLALGWFAVGDAGLSAREATGSLWWGSLVEARLGSAPLGNFDARLSPFPLFVGRARLDLASPDRDGVRGAISISRHSFGIDDVSGTLSAAILAPAPISALTLDDVSVRFRDGVCERAEGRVRAAVSGDLAALAQGLAGDVRCDGAAMLVPLVSASGAGRADLRLWADGRYRADLVGGGASVPVEGRLR